MSNPFAACKQQFWNYPSFFSENFFTINPGINKILHWCLLPIENIKLLYTTDILLSKASYDVIVPCSVNIFSMQQTLMLYLVYI